MHILLHEYPLLPVRYLYTSDTCRIPLSAILLVSSRDEPTGTCFARDVVGPDTDITIRLIRTLPRMSRMYIPLLAGLFLRLTMEMGVLDGFNRSMNRMTPRPSSCCSPTPVPCLIRRANNSMIRCREGDVLIGSITMVSG